MKSTNPWSARVVAEIGLEDAVAAIEHFVEFLPAGRFSLYISDRLFKAAREMEKKALTLTTCNTEPLLVTQKLDGAITDQAKMTCYGDITGRIDSSKENPCYGNREMAARAAELGDLARARVVRPGFGGDERAADHSDSTLCSECFVWSNNKGPSHHKMDCSRFGSALRRAAVKPQQEVEVEVWPQ